MHFIHRRAFAGVALLIAIVSGACDNFLEVENPGVIEAGTIDTPLVEEVREGCGQLIAQKESRIVVEHGDADPVVPGDRSQLLQLLRNLIVNALKYGRTGEDVTIRFEEADSGPVESL